MGYRLNLEPLKSIRSIDEIAVRLKKQHEDWLQDQRDLKVRRPVPEGTEDIIRLRTQSEIQQEGNEQSNCVGNRAVAVTKGCRFIYRVLKPERATLEIRRRSDCGRWEIDEIKGYRNKSVDKKTEGCVLEWLQRRDAEFMSDYRKNKMASMTRAVEEDEVPF